jgi:hypothetical protein
MPRTTLCSNSRHFSPGRADWSLLPDIILMLRRVVPAADIQAVQIAAITLAFLVLNGLLWYARPNGSLWLLGSILLGVIWGVCFLWLITKEPQTKRDHS